MERIQKASRGFEGFFVIDWQGCLDGVALLGATLHYGFNETMEMETDLFMELIQRAARLQRMQADG